jgi:aspartate racemase
MSFGKAIGIVGGVGPYAGLDLNRKIFDQTVAKTDQDHLRVVLISSSADIPDRTEYLLGKETINPARSIFKILQKLEIIGVEVAGIPCNTSHVPEIYDVFIGKLRETRRRIEIVHMIKEVAFFIKQYYPSVKNVGILGTNGTVHSGVYTRILKPKEFNVIYPYKDVQNSKVHPSIYDINFGIKAKSNPVTDTARESIIEAMKNLIDQGAECIILGCTELPLAINVHNFRGRPILDPTLILARALIKKVAPEKLMPLT